MAMIAPSSGEDWPKEFAPQHTGVPPVAMAQLWSPPELMARYVPAGGLAWPAPLAPQHLSWLLLVIAQVWSAPALSATKRPGRCADRAASGGRAPAAGRAVGSDGTRVLGTGADQSVAAGRWTGLADAVLAPAGEPAVRSEAAAIGVAQAQRLERARRRWGHDGADRSPAVQHAVDVDGAVEARAGIDGGTSERALRRGRLAVVVPAPTHGGAVCPDCAGMDASGADRREHASGRARLTVLVGAPACDCPVDPDRAGVGAAGADGNELPRRRVRLAGAVISPTDSGAVRSESAGELIFVSPGADGEECASRHHVCRDGWSGRHG